MPIKGDDHSAAQFCPRFSSSSPSLFPTLQFLHHCIFPNVVRATSPVFDVGPPELGSTYGEHLQPSLYSPATPPIFEFSIEEAANRSKSSFIIEKKLNLFPYMGIVFFFWLLAGFPFVRQNHVVVSPVGSPKASGCGTFDVQQCQHQHSSSSSRLLAALALAGPWH